MSMQRIINYGSFWQSYGLKTIESLGDNTVKFVDYKVAKSVYFQYRLCGGWRCNQQYYWRRIGNINYAGRNSPCHFYKRKTA